MASLLNYAVRPNQKTAVLTNPISGWGLDPKIIGRINILPFGTQYIYSLAFLGTNQMTGPPTELTA
jgi:hypothetical protein